MAEALVYSEREDLARELVAGALRLGLGQVSLVVAGLNARARARGLADAGASRVIACEAAPDASADAAWLADILAAARNTAGAEFILVGSTRRGKELAGRLAQKLGAGCVTDAIGLEVAAGEMRVKRYTLGGNAVATETIVTPVKVVSVMPKTFEAASPASQPAEVTELKVTTRPLLRTVGRRPKGTDSVDLESAERLVGVGKGLRSRDDLAMVEQLARAIGAEVGCTRTLAADYGWLSEDRLIGLSGKKCKPRLYLALGISGQIQHAVGVAGARIIAAVNTDKDAPMIKMADYSIIGDLYEAVPRLLALLT